MVFQKSLLGEQAWGGGIRKSHTEQERMGRVFLLALSLSHARTHTSQQEDTEDRIALYVGSAKMDAEGAGPAPGAPV